MVLVCIFDFEGSKVDLKGSNVEINVLALVGCLRSLPVKIVEPFFRMLFSRPLFLLTTNDVTGVSSSDRLASLVLFIGISKSNFNSLSTEGIA